MKPCAIEDCVRRNGMDWECGPILCAFHRPFWAADHHDELSDAERKHWKTWFKQTSPEGEVFTTWPLNFRADSGVGQRWKAGQGT